MSHEICSLAETVFAAGINQPLIIPPPLGLAATCTTYPPGSFKVVNTNNGVKLGPECNHGTRLCYSPDQGGLIIALLVRFSASCR